MTKQDKAMHKLLTRLIEHGPMTFTEMTRFFSKFPRGAYQAARKAADSKGFITITERPTEKGIHFESVMTVTEKGKAECAVRGWIVQDA